MFVCLINPEATFFSHLNKLKKWFEKLYQYMPILESFKFLGANFHYLTCAFAGA